jgi:hypothetical protein
MRRSKLAATRVRRALAVVALALFTAVWLLPGIVDWRAAAATGTTHAQETLLGQIRNQAEPSIDLTARDVDALKRFAQSGDQLGEAAFLATRGARSYYRIANGTGPDCFAVGPAQPTDYRLGQIMCAAAFPSAEQPLLDFTVLKQPTPATTSARILRSEGIAADGVAEIGFETPDGRLVARTPVIDNVYHVVVPPGQHVTRLLAHDASGAVVWSVPFEPVKVD